MCIAVKYGIWNVSKPEPEAVNALCQEGYPRLAARILASRGIKTPKEAHDLLDCNCPLPSPFLLTEMDVAAGRVACAMENHEKIAVFGDYDVDGITATCLLTDFLCRCGADCISYIPGRLEEGYGLNPMALHSLRDRGVKLIVTVDCGITAVEEAQLCRELGMELVITDHHECKDKLPQAVAIVDPHKPGDTYPHRYLSGVALAFKLACALSGQPEQVLADYADMVCLGTVADVIPLVGENRVFVSRGLVSLQHTTRPGLAALMKECGCDPAALNASSIGFMLAPRINAAGRMGQIDLALDLFMTQDPERASQVAKELCELNRQRQAVESDIYRQAVSMLPQGKAPDAIVLADESWHQGVVGIVASRIAEEYACPTFLICLDGEHGKASSRSHGGFNLFASLTALSDLLESYGGHELAAGFTITRSNIPEFRKQVSALAAEYFSGETLRTSLDIDCTVPPELMTLEEFEALEILEPTGSGCPKPVLMLPGLTVERVTMVGGGKHMRLRLRRERQVFNAIYFSVNTNVVNLHQGEQVDVAFLPQINCFQGERLLQMNVVDIRPSCAVPCGTETAHYRALLDGSLSPEGAKLLTPSRAVLATVWRYLASVPVSPIRESPVCLCRKIVRWSGKPMELEQLMICLDIFRDVGLLEQQRMHKYMTIRLTPGPEKADLNQSATMQLLLHWMNP